MKAILKINYTCNNNCIFCHEEHRNLTYNVKDIKKRITQLKKEGCKEIIISGGEPTLHKELYEILKFIKNRNIRTSIMTNGTMFNYPKYAEKMTPLIDKFYVSLHSTEENIHNKITNAESYKHTLNGIKNILGNSGNVTVRFVINKLNLDDIKDIPSFMGRIGISKIEFSLFEPVGNAEKNFEQLLPNFKKLKDKLKNLIKNSKSIKIYIDYLPLCFLENCTNYLIEDKIFNIMKFISPDEEEIIKGKIKLDMCKKCKKNYICQGPYKKFLNLPDFRKLIKPY